MKNLSIYFTVILSIFLLPACNNEAQKLKRELNRFIGSEIVIPESLIPFNLPEDMQKSDFYESKYKTVFYVEMESCTDCSFQKIIAYDNYFTKNNRAGASIFIIINNPDIAAIQSLMIKYGLSLTYFIDMDDEFAKNNPALSQNEIFQTFLTKDNKVVLVGNPTNNRTIFEMYSHSTLERKGV